MLSLIIQGQAYLTNAEVQALLKIDKRVLTREPR
jgi:hypothetical protein